ncbi:MAG: hypothetical protein K0Q73_3387, partial [Paenibacillus sp.]|nr:hypothetical protein [Paenibacillus sp.]
PGGTIALLLLVILIAGMGLKKVVLTFSKSKARNSVDTIPRMSKETTISSFNKYQEE